MNQVSFLVREALIRKSANQNAISARRWVIFYVVLSIVVAYDLQVGYMAQSSGKIWYAGLVVCIISVFILVKLLLAYALSYFNLAPIEVTDKQRSLLSIGETDPGFKSTTPVKASSTPVVNKNVSLSSLFNATLRSPGPVLPGSPLTPPGSVTPVNMSAGSWGNFSAQSSPMNASHVSSPGGNFSMSSSNSGSVSADSWAFHCNQSSIMDGSYNAMTSPHKNVFSPSQLSESFSCRSSPAALSPARRSPPIKDQEELQEYMQQYQEREKRRHIMSASSSSTNMNTSLWGYGTNPHSQMADYVHLLRKNVFQTATKDADPTADANSSKNDDSKASALLSSTSSKIWGKRNVTNEHLFQFTENLRVWMSANILVPLVKNIEECNRLLRASAPEIQIGSVGVDKLKKAAHNITGVKNLGEVFPFLDLTIHQDYLIHRLKELSKGGAISAYRWNSGSSSFNGKPWKEEYPTDTAILLHLFVMYMDQKIPPDIQQQDGRMFSNVYLVKAPEKPTKPTDKPILHLSEINPPHLKVVLPSDEECDVGSGRNNFIHSLLLFIHHVTHQQHSRIANINLTLSGVNLAWVVTPPKS